jgi:hypothetical protein
MPGLVSTSIAAEQGRPNAGPSADDVARAAAVFASSLARHLDATLDGDLPPAADPVSERTALERLADVVPA